jgi:hypothetical protein
MTKAPNPTGFSDGLRNLCRETCAEYGDPPCFMLPKLCDPCDHITPCEECLTAAISELVEGLQACMIGGNHLALHLPENHPPTETDPLEALEKMGAGIDYDIWCAWRSIGLARALIAKYGDKT